MADDGTVPGIGSDDVRRINQLVSNVAFVDDKLGVQFRAVVPLVSPENEDGASKLGSVPASAKNVSAKGADVPTKPSSVPAKEDLSLRMLEQIQLHPGTNRKKLAEILNVDVRTIGRHLASLRGKVEFRGATKNGGYWVMDEENTDTENQK